VVFALLHLMAGERFIANQVLTRSRFMKYSVVSRFRKGIDCPVPSTYRVCQESVMFPDFSGTPGSSAYISLRDDMPSSIGQDNNRNCLTSTDRPVGGRVSRRPLPDWSPDHMEDVFFDQIGFISDNFYHIPATVRPPMGAPMPVPFRLKNGTA